MASLHVCREGDRAIGNPWRIRSSRDQFPCRFGYLGDSVDRRPPVGVVFGEDHGLGLLHGRGEVELARGGAAAVLIVEVPEVAGGLVDGEAGLLGGLAVHGVEDALAVLDDAGGDLPAAAHVVVRVNRTRPSWLMTAAASASAARPATNSGR